MACSSRDAASWVRATSTEAQQHVGSAGSAKFGCSSSRPRLAVDQYVPHRLGDVTQGSADYHGTFRVQETKHDERLDVDGNDRKGAIPTIKLRRPV